MDHIVVIEDNHEIQQLLVDILELNGYQASTANDGAQGLKLVQETQPDLVISDIMMPKMDGFELLEKLRASSQFNDLPIILLTARVMMDDRLKGLESGAQDYITKPFEMKELLYKVKNLLQLKKSSAKEAAIRKSKKILSRDERFIQSVEYAIEERITDPKLSLTELAEALEISTSSLQKKLKRINAKSVSQFIREYRLSRAKELITADHGNLTEISNMTGFSNLSYFSKSFKDYFGFAPSMVNSEHA